MPQTETISSLTEQLAALVDRPVAAADLERASLHVVDWLGCAMAGLVTETGRILAADLGGSFLGRGGGLTDPGAEIVVSAIGGLGSLLEMDDLHKAALLHPGPVIIPAAIAASRDGAGADLLAAIIRGYEAMIRIGKAVGPTHYAFYHNTGTCGGFGAAMAAGHAGGLDRLAIVNALGLAGSIAGGLWQCRNEPVASKAFHVAEASRRGVAAARLASRGLTAPRFILEGPQGFFKAQAPGADPADVLAGAGGDWLVHGTSFKPWPACRHAHPVIDATLAIRKRTGPVPLGDIAGVRIETYSDSVLFCDRMTPQTEVQAKFSLQHAVAVCLERGRPELGDFSMEAVGRPELAAHRAKVAVAASDAFSAAYPAHFGASVTLHLADGREFTERVADAWGDPENPIGGPDILAKARGLMQACGLAPAGIDRIIDASLGLAHGGRLDRLREALDDSRLTALPRH